MMKNKFKIITVILSCLLLIGATVGIFVSAEGTDPSVSIYKKSVNYDGALEIHYAIDANLADGQQVKVLFSYDAIAAPTGAVDESAYEMVGTIAANDEITINNVTYPLVYSPGIAPVDMTKPIYALPVVVDADNNVVVVAGDLDKFSIFDYCMERFSGTSTPDQYQLYKALLAYGASAQEVMLESGLYTEEQLNKYGYADEYYVAKITNNVDSTVTYERFRESDVTLEAPKTYGGKIFAGFTDAAGNALTMYGAANTASSWNYYDTTLEIGENEFVYNYGATGTVQTWTDADGADLTLKGSGLFFPDTKPELTVDTTSKTLVWADVIDGALAFGSTNTASWRPFEIMNKNATAGAKGKTYVFETDMNINWENDATSTSDLWLVQFGFTSNAWYADGDDFALFAINRTSTTEYMIQCLDYTGGNWAKLVTGLKFDKTYNLRIEYEITSLGTTSTTPADSTGTGNVNIYINGELQATFTATGYRQGMNNKTFTGIGFLDRGYKGTGTHTVYFDNTYIATED